MCLRVFDEYFSVKCVAQRYIVFKWRMEELHTTCHACSLSVVFFVFSSFADSRENKKTKQTNEEREIFLAAKEKREKFERKLVRREITTTRETDIKTFLSSSDDD